MNTQYVPLGCLDQAACALHSGERSTDSEHRRNKSEIDAGDRTVVSLGLFEGLYESLTTIEMLCRC